MKLDYEVLKGTFAHVGKDLEAFSTRFYRELFQGHPHLRSLFPDEMQLQRKKLAQSVAVILGRLGEPESMTTMLRNLGARHVAYGVRSEYYPAVIEALVSALRGHVGEAFDARVEAEWRKALGWVAEQMIAGSESAAIPVA